MHVLVPVILQFVSIILLSMLMVSLWEIRDRPIIKTVFVLIVLLQLWFIEFAVEIMVPTLELKVFFSNLQFFPLAFFPTVLLLVVLRYTGRSELVRIVAVFGSIFPLATNVRPLKK